MGTRGLFGFVKNGKPKLMYNHFDSYPEGLGKCMCEFISTSNKFELNDMYKAITLVAEHKPATAEEADFCITAGLYDNTVSSGEPTDWYCLLRREQGDLNLIRDVINRYGKAYMIDSHTFIEDSLFCEFAYIINLDTDTLDIYRGYVKNAYPIERDPETGRRHNRMYLPCQMYMSVPLEDLYGANDIEIDETISIASEVLNREEE